MTISELLGNAARILKEAGIVDPRREANSLLAFALEKDKTFLIAHPEYELSIGEEKRFHEIVRRRASREPFQYITGRQEFFGLDFEVAKDVLIPRPETELIVESAIELLRKNETPGFFEIGVGSGCISIALLREVKNARAVGVDVSEKALQIARKNAETHGVLTRLDLKTSDLFAALNDEKFDLIVSNPPYISAKDFETLQPEVRDFEPRSALTDEQNGLSFIAKIIDRSPEFLKPGGFLLLEIGFDQAKKVRAMFRLEIWRVVEILPDLQDIPRIVKAQILD